MSINILGKEYPIATTTILYLSYKNLTEMPESIRMLTNLETLCLYGNKLTSLNESIGSLSNLQELYLTNNNLTNISESIGSLSNLKKLSLSYNNLTSLHESIGSLSKLQVLYLNNNNLTSLPESIQNLSNLRVLNLSNNNLTSLPESIGKLSNLKELYLYNNNLTSLWVDKKQGFLSSPMVMNRKSETFSIHAAPESIKTLTKIKRFKLDESSYDINNLSMDCHTLILTDIKNNITNLPPILRTLYLKHCVNVDMIKLPYGCDIIRF